MTQSYQDKKAFFNQIITIYGRNAVFEALEDDNLEFYKLHLADSNKDAAILSKIIQKASVRGIEIVYHDKKELSRISKNGKQDQGIAADILCPGHQHYTDFLLQPPTEFSFIAVDGVTNPQNLGMIIRSICASHLSGLLLPTTGNAAIGPLVIKASVGTVFRTPILRCDKLEDALVDFKKSATQICCLTSQAKESLYDFQPKARTIYVLGNESEGVSKNVSQLADTRLVIPMNRKVESLNVAVTAALIAFR